MRWVKYVSISLLTIVVLIGAVASPWGTRAILSVADSSLDELSIDYTSGSLVTALALKRVRWQSPDISLSVNNILVDVDWSCALTMRVCLSHLNTSKVVVKVLTPPQPKPETPAAPLTRLVLPFPVAVNSLEVRNISVSVPQTMDLNIQSVTSSASMFRTLNLAYLEVSGVHVALPPAPPAANEPVNIAAIANWHYQPPAFAPLVFPLVMKASNLNFNNVWVTQGDQEIIQITSLQAAIDMTPKMLTISKLNITHPQGDVSLTANVDRNWQHKLQASVHSKQYNVNGDIHAHGSPKNINIDLLSTGAVNLSAKVNADLSAAQLPVTLTAKWQDVNWPLQAPQISSAQGMLELKGDLQLYQLTVQSSIQGKAFPGAKIDLKASGNNRQALIERMQVQTLDGEFNIDGDVKLDEKLQWQGGLRFKEIKPQVFWPQLSAQVAGNIIHNGQFDGQNWRANISQLSATGTWQGYALAAKGSAGYDPKQGLKIPQLTLSTGQNSLQIAASIEQFANIDAQLSLRANDLSQLYPALEGKSEVNATLSGTLAEPKVVFDARAQNLFIEQLSITNLNAQGEVWWDSAKSVDLALTLAHARIADQDIESLELTLKGDAGDHNLTLNMRSNTLNLLSKFAGELTPHQWSGHWDTADFSFDGGQFSLDNASPEILANWQQGTYSLSPFCWSDDAAQLCVNNALYQAKTATFDISATELPVLQLVAAYIPRLATVQTDAALSLGIAGTWAGKGLPKAKAHAELTPSTWSVEGQKNPLHLQSLYVDLDTVDQPGSDKQDLVAKLHLLSEQLGVISAQLNVQASPGERPVQGLIKLDDLQLKALQNFVPQLTELDGEINGQLNLTGTLKAPMVKGTVKLQEGTFAGAMLPARINHVEQTFTFEGHNAKLSGPFQLGNGKGEINGTFNWQDQLAATLKVTGSDMEIDYQNLVRAKLSPDINIELTSAGLTVEGELSLPYARVKVRELPPEALSPSKDVVLVNDTETQQQSTTPLYLKLQVNIDPKRNNDVKLDAFGLTSDLQGSLLLSQSGKVLSANGELNLVNGRYKAYGQDLVIRQGEVQFSGPIDSPYLNIEAIRDPLKTADSVIAGLRIEGNAEQPSISVFSDPAMEQPEALSYLLRGLPIAGQGDTSNDAMLANALIGFGLGKSENQVSTLGRSLGVEDLALNTSGQGDETKLSVSGYIAPGVQLRYGVGVFDSASEVALRYQLMPKLYLEAVSGLENALDIYYQFSIYEDGNKPVDDGKIR
ncbi:MAG: translocation and assembly module TamB [Paraglaciecola sp.]|jgi:translocation and assembly module TamB